MVIGCVKIKPNIDLDDENREFDHNNGQWALIFVITILYGDVTTS